MYKTHHKHETSFIPSFPTGQPVVWLGGGNSNIFEIFTPIPREMIQFDYSNIFQMAWNHQLVTYCWWFRNPKQRDTNIAPENEWLEDEWWRTRPPEMRCHHYLEIR